MHLEYIENKDINFNSYIENIFNKTEYSIKEKLEKYVSLFDEIQCVHQLYELYLYNLETMHERLLMYYNDEIYRRYDGEKADRIEVNALLINLISSGKTLVDSIEAFLKGEFDNSKFEEFKNMYIKNAYDEEFSYRIMYLLRNYAQHGGLPVSISIYGKYCIDIYQILNTKHFSITGEKESELKDITQKIFDQFGSEPRIALVKTVVTYNRLVLEIYYELLKVIEPECKSRYNSIQKIIADNPQLIINLKDSFEGMIVYKIVDDNMHMFSAKENYLNMFIDMIKGVKKNIDYYNSIDNE